MPCRARDPSPEQWLRRRAGRASCSTTSRSGASSNGSTAPAVASTTPCTTAPSTARRSSWEALRAEVDLQLANSTWTADQIEAETGHRPEVVLSGIDRSIFAPHGGPKRNVEVLCTGDRRDWKGTDTILAAGGAPRRAVDEPTRPRTSTSRRSAASTPRPASSWSGAGSRASASPDSKRWPVGRRSSPPTTAAAASTPMDGETALVVPPRDVGAMADAMARLLDDPELAARLVVNGLDVVAATSTGNVAPTTSRRYSTASPRAPWPPRRLLARCRRRHPTLSVVVLAWGNLAHTQRCVECVRRHTDVDHELIVIDNGSGPDAADYARLAGGSRGPQPGEPRLQPGDEPGSRGGAGSSTWPSATTTSSFPRPGRRRWSTPRASDLAPGSSCRRSPRPETRSSVRGEARRAT